MPMPTGNGENPQFYEQWTVEDSENWLYAKSFTRQKSLSAWIPGLSILKVQGSQPPLSPSSLVPSWRLYFTIRLLQSKLYCHLTTMCNFVIMSSQSAALYVDTISILCMHFSSIKSDSEGVLLECSISAWQKPWAKTTQVEACMATYVWFIVYSTY